MSMLLVSSEIVKLMGSKNLTEADGEQRGCEADCQAYVAQGFEISDQTSITYCFMS